MNRYQKGKIYKLVNDVDDKIYIGSSCMELPKRFYSHKSAAKLKGQIKVYKHLNAIGWDYVHIILVESFPCSNKMELEKRERYWIETLSPSLNKCLPAQTNTERMAHLIKYRTNNERKKHINKYMKNYRQNNKQLLSINRSKPYQCVVCDCEIRLAHKAVHMKTFKHIDNIPSYMANLIQKYREVKPIEIMHYSLE